VDRLEPTRVPFDIEQYARRSREGPCFVCAILAGSPGYPHHVVYEDADAIAFLSRYPTMRMYCLSLGSQQGNAHLHWHVAPLPPAVPYDQQQFYALMAENGVLKVDEASQAALAEAIRSHL
jgi:histidine triad (HIT) family protein/ATP adenylyltransferase